MKQATRRGALRPGGCRGGVSPALRPSQHQNSRSHAALGQRRRTLLCHVPFGRLAARVHTRTDPQAQAVVGGCTVVWSKAPESRGGHVEEDQHKGNRAVARRRTWQLCAARHSRRRNRRECIEVLGRQEIQASFMVRHAQPRARTVSVVPGRKARGNRRIMEIVYGQGANRVLGRSGTFWQREYWDTLIRTEEHFNRAVAYIEANPERAGLANWPWVGRALSGE